MNCLRTLSLGSSLLLLANTFGQAGVQGTAQTRYYGGQTISTSLHSSGNYRLYDPQRKLQVRDGHFGSSNHEVLSGSAQWTPRITISNLNISSFGPGGADRVELLLQTTNGTAIRSMSPAFAASGGDLPVSLYNLTAYQGANRVLIRTVSSLGVQVDTLGSFVLQLSTGTQSFSWPNGAAGSISVTGGDASLDIYWGLTRSYDFFWNRFGWKPTGLFQTIDARINVPDADLEGSQYNANANVPTRVLRFGTGGSLSNVGPYVALDVVSHEYAHLVLNWYIPRNGPCNGSNTEFTAEQQALIESFADMMAVAVENQAAEQFGALFPASGLWSIGERLFSGGHVRSMSNPPIRRYNSIAWNDAVLGGYPYQLAGVTNYWFYLLANGGSEIVNGQPFEVQGIGLDAATDIAYYGFTQYSGIGALSCPSMEKVKEGTIEAAIARFPGGYERLQVLKAWYAVGLLESDPSLPCSGSTWVGETGSFGDGSGAEDYAAGLDCNWLIKPTGAQLVNLQFTSFNLGSGDQVIVHGGDNSLAPVLGTFSGTSIPSVISHIGGSLFIRFVTDGTGTGAGWNLTYNTNGQAPYCSSAEYPLSALTGVVADGSGTSNYNPNTTCAWYIAPPGATSVTLSFTAFETEGTYDLVKIYGSVDTSQPPIAVLSGSSIPTPVVSNTGGMFITFTTNGSNSLAGWSANYTSTGASHCSGLSTLPAPSGTFTDGSGAASYFNNTHCAWLIQPVGASAVQLDFTAFAVEQASSTGTIYDRVVVRDGATADSPIIGTYYGSIIPGTTTSSGPAMYVEFITDNATVADGWEATYTSLTGTYCSGTTLLTGVAGAFSDGSGAGDYGNNATCNWLIQPDDAVSIQLTFDAFSTQLNADGVIVYDGPSTSSPVLGIYTGSTLPPTLSSSGGAMLVRFVSDAATTGAGFEAHYVANISQAGALALIGYEYWFDEGSTTYQSISPTYQYMMDREVDTDGLGSGLHTLHVRFKDNQGSWSSVLSQSFYKALEVPGSTPLLAEWEHWFDDAYDEAVVGSLSGIQEVVDTGLESAGLPDGLHTAHMRFRGSGGWSSVLSQSFYKAPSSSSGNATINGYAYWFDDDMGTLVSASVSPTAQFALTDAMDAADLPNGLHTMHIRFQGDGGWSSVLSQSFFKSGNANSLPNLVDGYRYWFDDQEVDMETVVLNTPLSPYTLNSPINAQGLSVGQHVLHIQFRDLGGSWSSVLSQGFERVATPSVLVPIRMFLEGPFDSTSLLMSDAMRAAGLVPTEEPYTGLGFDHVGEGGGESTSTAVLSVTGSNAIVDWVFVEVRDNVLNNLVLNTRCALVQRDGDVVDMDGVSPLSMDLAPGNYYIVVRHRNHLGAMTANTAALSSETGLIDFASTSVQNYGTEGQKVLAGRKVLWSGNSFHDGLLKYTGANNDRDPILVRIGGIVLTNTVQGYFTEDVTMDGLVKYTGALNDRDPILVNIGGTVPTNVRFEQLP